MTNRLTTTLRHDILVVVWGINAKVVSDNEGYGGCLGMHVKETTEYALQTSA